MKINNYNLKLNDDIKSLLDDYKEYYTPSKCDIFKSLELTNFEDVKVVLIGQDPYPNLGDACGLSFSVKPGQKIPASLRNIFKELYNDLGISKTDGDLSCWAKQGVLLLNLVLTNEVGQTKAHFHIGWQDVTGQIIKDLSDRGKVIFLLLGKDAQKIEKNIDESKNYIIKTSHPSPLGAYRGFNGSKIFSQINEKLIEYNYDEIQW